MNLIAMDFVEGSFLHPATPFVILGVILPFLRGRFWRWLMFIPPAMAVFLTLHAHPGIYWQVSYVGQVLVLGRVDALSLPFIILFALMTPICILFSFHVREKAQHVASLFFMGAAFGSVLAGDYWTLYLFWQGMTVSSSFLIWLNRKGDASKTGFLYMMFLLLSSVLLLAGILLRQRISGTFVFGPAEGKLMFHYDYFILGAFAINAALVPVHAWMTQGLPKATIPGAVLLSVFGIKTALYAMARCYAGLDILIVLGAIAAVYGGFHALFSNNIRRIIAYLLVAQTGLMVTGIGMDAQAAREGAVFLAYANTFYTALLLMSMGAIIHATGEDQLLRLGHLAGKLPFLAVSTLIGVLALCAVPFFSGFPGISLILEEALKLAAPIPGSMLVLLLGFAILLIIMAGGLRLPYYVFLFKRSGNPIIHGNLPRNMVAATTVTGLFCLIQGLFPERLIRLLSYPVETLSMTFIKLTIGVLFPAATLMLFIFLSPLLKPKDHEPPDFERVYQWIGRLVMMLLSKPLAWADSAFSKIYGTVFLRAFNYMARASDALDRKGIDGAVNRTATSVMFLSRMSTKLQSRSLQDQLARMMLLVLAVVVLIWLW